MNMNDMAKRIARSEGGAQSLSIAQIKEVLRLVLHELKKMTLADVTKLLARVK